MSLLKTFEKRISHYAENLRIPTNNAGVRPVEIASAIQQEIKEIQAKRSPTQTHITPNRFRVDLSSYDYNRLILYENNLKAELSIFVKQCASNEDLLLISNPLITLHQDNELSAGIFRITASILRKQKTQKQSPSHTIGARLIINGISYNILKDPCVIGRSKKADIQIEDNKISRKHALLGLTPKPFIRDLRSTNGTFINKIQISECPLEDNTKIQLGSATITYRIDANE